MRNNTIDGFRLIAAFFVVCLHAGVPGLGAILAPFFRMAVPFFFLISGFYLYDVNRERMNEKIAKSLKRIISIWFQATVIYAIVSYLCFPEDWLEQARLFLSIKFWLLNIAPFNSVLWYLLAYLYTLIIIYGLNKFLDFSKISKISFFLMIIPGLIVNYCIGEFSPFIFKGTVEWVYQLNFVTMGFPIVMSGLACGKYKQSLPKISGIKFLMGLFLFYLIALGQWYVIKHITHEGVNTSLFFASTLPMVFLTLLYSLSNPNIFNDIISKWGRLYSLDIYVYHIMFLWPVYLLGLSYPSVAWLKNAIVIFILTIGFAILKYVVKLKIKQRHELG